MSLLRNSAIKAIWEMSMKSFGFLSTIALRYLKQPFLKALGLHSIWLTWKHVFSQSWLGVYSCLLKTGVHCVCMALKKGFSSPREALDVTVSLLACRTYTLHRQSVWHKTRTFKEEIKKLTGAIKSNKRPTTAFLLVNFSIHKTANVNLVVSLYSKCKSG